MNERARFREIFYGWVVLGAAFLIIMIGIGTTFSSGVFLILLEDLRLEIGARGEGCSHYVGGCSESP